MAHLVPTQRSEYWAGSLAGEIVLADTLPVGQALATGLELRHSPDEAVFLAETDGLAGSFDPLPQAGGPVEAGRFYGHAGSLVIARRAHSRTSHAPADVPGMFAVHRVGSSDELDWIEGEPVQVGMDRRHDARKFRAKQAHETASAPPEIPDTWEEIPE